jgi:cbb3-type cytochrome oxidase maturation protein
MNILLVLIPVTLLVIVIAVALFFWAVNHQQFDDLDSPGVLPLLDEPAPADADHAKAGTEPPADAPTDDPTCSDPRPPER